MAISGNKRALLLINRQARRGQKDLSKAVSQLISLNFNLVIESAQEPHHISDIIRHYRDQVELVIVGGGDSTLNAAIEGLVDTQLPLGILPMGTANDLACTLGIPDSLLAACDAIDTDGEITTTPAHLRVFPKAISVFIPSC